MGDGTHYLAVGKKVRNSLGVEPGDAVRVMLEIETEEKRLEIPEEIKRALAKQPTAEQEFKEMTYSHQKEWVNWILSAKREETRLRRIEKAISITMQGKNLRNLSHPS